MKRFQSRFAAGFGVLLVSSAVIAQDMSPTGPPGSAAPGEQGILIGLRAGYGIPFGTAYGVRDATTGTIQNAKLSDQIKGMFPLSVEIGYWFEANWYVGGFFQYGIGLVQSNAICSTVSCSTSDLRFGLSVHYHFLPGEIIDPWVGIGAGYEILNQSASGTILGVAFNVSGNLSGWEFGNAQAGVDLNLSPMFSVGPFVEFAVAQYSSGSISFSAGGGPQQSGSSSIDNKTIHEWLNFGLRFAMHFSID
jgi:hypothetical protein